MTATVLIVDDTPGNLAVLSDMLAEYGYRVLVATDGLSAIEQTSLAKPDIILLDVLMPGIDGFETCRRLKASPHTEHIPILFMTGLSELENLLKGFDEGGVDYITKPIKPEEVLARVDAQLSQSLKYQRAEKTLDQTKIAALTLTRKGQITWISNEAKKIIFPLDTSIQSYKTLPEKILTQCLAKTTKDENRKIILNNQYQANIFEDLIIDELFMLLIKSTDDWDQASIRENFGLTLREAEILMWISRGKTNKEVGLILETSPRTVNKHLEHIFEKLGVPTRTAAVAKVLNSQTIY